MLSVTEIGKIEKNEKNRDFKIQKVLLGIFKWP